MKSANVPQVLMMESGHQTDLTDRGCQASALLQQ